MNDKIAAIPSFFLSTYGDGGGTGGYGAGATLTPHVGQNSAFASIIPPQLTQNLLSFSYEDPDCSNSDNTLIAILVQIKKSFCTNVQSTRSYFSVRNQKLFT